MRKREGSSPSPRTIFLSNSFKFCTRRAPEDFCIQGETMKISRLLDQHRKFKSQGLADSLGDGYLMAHNRVFKKIRMAALEAGYQFSSARDEAYETFPLLQLEPLLQEKVLPYSRNVLPLERLTAGQLDVLSWEDIDGNLKRNFVFHEACHAVVRVIGDKYFGGLNVGTSLDSQRQFATRMLLEESCANTCEFLGCAEASDQTHRLFYEMNSYVCEYESRTYLKNAMVEIGQTVVVKIMVLAYLQANFLRYNLEDKQFQLMLKIASDNVLDLKQQKALRAMAKVAFNLSERFRVQTTSFHLRLAGIHTPIEDLFDFPFLEVLFRRKGFENFLGEFAALFE